MEPERQLTNEQSYRYSCRKCSRNTHMGNVHVSVVSMYYDVYLRQGLIFSTQILLSFIEREISRSFPSAIVLENRLTKKAVSCLNFDMIDYYPNVIVALLLTYSHSTNQSTYNSRLFYIEKEIKAERSCEFQNHTFDTTSVYSTASFG